MRHADFVQYYNDFISLFGAEAGEQKYYAMITSYGLDETKSYASQLTRECLNGICESFGWTPEYIKLVKSDTDAKYYKVRALTATLSANYNDYSNLEELERSARTLTWRPLNINHDHSRFLPFPENRVDWAEYEDKAVEAIIRISNDQKDIQYQLDNEEIVNPSIEGEPRGGYTNREGHKVPAWYNFTALALLEKDVTLPGVPTTYGFEPLFLNESLGRSLVESLSNVEQEQKKEKKKMTENKKLTEAEARNESCAQCSHFKEYLPNTVKTPKVEGSEPSDAYTLTSEGGIGPGVGLCEVSGQLVRKNDAACTDWRQRSTPTSADNTQRTYEQAESVEALIMKKEKEDLENQLLIVKRKHNDEMISHVTTRGDLVEAQRQIATKDKEIAIHVAKIGRLETKYEDIDRKLDKALTRTEELQVRNDNLESDSKFMKDTLERREIAIEVDRKTISQLKNSLAEALTKQNNESATRAEAVQRANDAVNRESQVLQDNAILSADLVTERQKVYDLSQRNADYAREVMKLQREKNEIKQKHDALIETIRDLKRKVGKPPRVVLKT